MTISRRFPLSAHTVAGGFPYPRILKPAEGRPLAAGAPDGFLAGGRPSPAFPGAVDINAEVSLVSVVKPAQAVPAIVAVITLYVVARAEIGAAGHIPGAPSPASIGRRGRGPLQPELLRGRGSPSARPSRAATSAVISRYGLPLRPGKTGGINVERADVVASPVRASQSAGIPAILRIRAVALGRDDNPLDPLSPPPFLFRKLKDAVNADPGNPGFPVGQPALLGGDKAAENAAFPGIDGIVPFIAVFAGRPGFGFGKGIGLVKAAVEGLAPVFGQGFQNGDSPVGVGKGLPIGTVPGDGPGLRRGCPPPPSRL